LQTSIHNAATSSFNIVNLSKVALLALFTTVFLFQDVKAQHSYELNTGWKCAQVGQVKGNGATLSQSSYSVANWLPATVPGTVLTTLLNNKKIPDPFYGMNNAHIKDIHDAGRDYYTYWFIKDFDEAASKNGQQVYLNFRGINYSSEVYLNGKKVNPKTHTGMFLRECYNITALLNKSGKNRLAVVVYPPDPVGNPNGGQGGDGRIAKGVGLQYTAGWDWIQPVRDRNTGIWDKVTIEKTGEINLMNPHVITLVPGLRKAIGPQQPAIIKASADLQNPTKHAVTGVLQYVLEGKTISKTLTLAPNSSQEISLPDFILKNPKLWWPNGYGPQHLYNLKMQFLTAGNQLSDQENVSIGVRQITTSWNSDTKSRQVEVNGQKIFIKGGNWIISDAMLRFSEARYDAEVRFHRDMNLNLIRVWGGALVERPEFYQACDKYGLLVFQDFWISGDANGKWVDPMKADDQWTRRKYPDDHALYLKSVADQIKMVRNHASLAIWCGGNEITPPEDILLAVRDTIMPKLDGTRWFVDYSNSDKMSLNTLGGNGDGPYGLQPISAFWEDRTYPFNSEVGSVGLSDYESLQRFIPERNLVAPAYSAEKKNTVDSVWEYHKYIGYDASIDPYGKAKDAKDFAAKAQLVNYDQYRALIEGFSAHMWSWYTGTIIWKTQNPWTAMRGQMYDYYLDPNAALYGLHNGSEPLHPMYNPVTGMVSVVNNTLDTRRDLMLTARTINMTGADSLLTQVFVEVQPSSVKGFFSLKGVVDHRAHDQGVFLCLQLFDKNKNKLSENIYWFSDAKGNYSGLQEMPRSSVQTSARKIAEGKVEVTLSNPAKAPMAFFNRISLVDPATNKRILPVFYSDNYISVLPGDQKKIILDYSPKKEVPAPVISLSGWNLREQHITIK
jgi:mannosylglycoprotein endo-beta-mannosidase